MTDVVPTSIDRVTQGDPAAARRLRANLVVYARRSEDSRARSLVADVLAGRRDVGEVLRSEDFNRVGDTHLDNLQQGIEQLSPEDRARAFDPDRDRTPAAELAALRDGGDPGDGWAADDVDPRDPLLRHLR